MSAPSLGESFDVLPSDGELEVAFAEYVKTHEWNEGGGLNDGPPNKPTRWEIIPADDSRLRWLKVYVIWEPTGNEMESLWQAVPIDLGTEEEPVKGIGFIEIF